MKARNRKGNSEYGCAYPMDVKVPSINDLDYSELGFKDNGEHAIHRENKKKNKG